MDYVRYFATIRKLREEFTASLAPLRPTEVYKIWARWIITHRSLFPQNSIFLPSDDLESDSQILVELTDKGVQLNQAIEIYKYLTIKTDIINKFPIIRSAGNMNYYFNDDCNIGDTNGEFVYTMNSTVLQKLTNSYKKNMVHTIEGIGAIEDESTDITKAKDGLIESIWLCQTLYNLLDGRGLQWAVPRAVMRALSTHYGCKTELFASPINFCYHDYYSLFESDKVFGSKGNFFTADPNDFTEGAFQVNPPFIDPLFSELTCRIIHFLEIAESRDKELTFIYIMPDWSDCEGYDKLVDSKYCTKVIRFQKDRHYYYQYDTGTYIPARFGTCVIIMSTNPNISTYEAEKDLKNGFRYQDIL